MGESVGIPVAMTYIRQKLVRLSLVVRRFTIVRLRSRLYPCPGSLLCPFPPYTDKETALELSAALPKDSVVTVERLESALQDFRRQSLGYEVRVKQALASLGLRMAS